MDCGARKMHARAQILRARVFLSLHLRGRGPELISLGISSGIFSSPSNNQITPAPDLRRIAPGLRRIVILYYLQLRPDANLLPGLGLRTFNLRFVPK